MNTNDHERAGSNGRDHDERRELCLAGATPPVVDKGQDDEGGQHSGDAFKKVLALAVGVYRDRLNNPLIKLPGDEERNTWPLRHPRVRAWLAKELYKVRKEPRDLKLVESLLRLLEAEAWEGEVIEAAEGSVLKEIERDIVGLAIVAYANKIGKDFEGLTRDLQQRLADMVPELSRQATKRREFPKLTQQFSMRLNRLRPALGEIGIKVEVWHRDIGSHCSLTLDPERFCREPDASPDSPSAPVRGQKDAACASSEASDEPDASRPNNEDQAEMEKALLEIDRIGKEEP